MTPATVYTLLVVLLTSGGETTSYSRTFPTATECSVAEALSRRAAANAIGLAAVVPHCVPTTFPESPTNDP